MKVKDAFPDEYKVGLNRNTRLPVRKTGVLWSQRDSNPPPTDCEPVALPDELWPHWICIHKPTAEWQNCQLVRPSEEAMKRLKIGCDLFGRLLNSGWYCTPTKNGWSASSTASTSVPSGLVPLMTKPLSTRS